MLWTEERQATGHTWTKGQQEDAHMHSSRGGISSSGRAHICPTTMVPAWEAAATVARARGCAYTHVGIGMRIGHKWRLRSVNEDQEHEQSHHLLQSPPPGIPLGMPKPNCSSSVSKFQPQTTPSVCANAQPHSYHHHACITAPPLPITPVISYGVCMQGSNGGSKRSWSGEGGRVHTWEQEWG